MNRIRLFSVVALLCTMGMAAFGQTLVVHYGDHEVRLPLGDIDSLTFTDEPAVVPRMIEVDVTHEAVDGGGSDWVLPISATMRDGDGNPVPDGYPVEFGLSPNLGVVSNGVTGNEGVDGSEGEPGVAHGSLRYASGNTNQTVTLVARWPYGDRELADSLSFPLPLQQPSGVLSVDPFNFSFSSSSGEAAIIQATCTVRDGHGVLIANQRVRFNPQYGGIYATREGTTEDPIAVTDANGVATRFWRVTLDDLSDFPDDPVIQALISVEILGGVGGSDVEPIMFFFYQ